MSAAGDARAWWRSAVVYQVYPRSFADANGDGIGDLAGVLSRLDHLERLGVDVVWVSPIYRSPHRDNGYDISDYRAVDPAFGTLEELDRLVEELHRRGIKLVMDLVVNHTSDAHPWFAESRSSRTSPKRDWYWWRPPRPGKVGPASPVPSQPTGDRSSAARRGRSTSHRRVLPPSLLARPTGSQLGEQGVRAAVYEMMRWWLDRGVDGFRMDVINLISKDTALPDGPAAEGDLATASPPTPTDRDSTSSSERCAARCSPSVSASSSRSGRCRVSPPS